MKFSIASTSALLVTLPLFISTVSAATGSPASILARRNGNGGGKGKGKGKGKNNNGGGGGDSQSSLTLLSNLVQENSKGTGHNASAAGQSDSITSENNFINFCDGKTLTNGEQNKEGSCNGIPMGDIPSVDNMVTAKFQEPKNFDTIEPNTDFDIKIKISNMKLGNFVNAKTNYYSAPQHLDGDVITGHTHVVVAPISSLDSTDVSDPLGFKFFKGIDAAPGSDGNSVATVTGGLDAGTYRLCSITTSANHVPVLMPVAQHDCIDDCVYFTVGGGKGKNGGGGGNDNGNGNDDQGNNDQGNDNQDDGASADDNQDDGASADDNADSQDNGDNSGSQDDASAQDDGSADDSQDGGDDSQDGGDDSQNDDGGDDQSQDDQSGGDQSFAADNSGDDQQQEERDCDQAKLKRRMLAITRRRHRGGRRLDARHQ